MVEAEAPVGPADAYVADDVVLRIDEFSDIPEEQPEPARMPTLIVYGDGRVITRERADTAVPSLSLRTMSIDAVEALARLVIDAGGGWRSQANLGEPWDRHESLS